MNIVIPDWTRDFVTATIENDHGQTITQYTGWRATLDPSHMRRYPTTYTEWDLTVVADDALHGPGQCGSDCHDPGDRSGNMLGMSVPDGDERDVIDAARTALAEQGFRIAGPWIAGPNGALTAPLMPVIVDPTCAAYEPETAAQMPDDPQDQSGWSQLPIEMQARIKAAWLNARGADVCPACLGFRANGSCLNCTMIAERAEAAGLAWPR